MAKSPGSWFHVVDLQQHYTEGMTGAFIVKLNNNRDTDERAHFKQNDYWRTFSLAERQQHRGKYSIQKAPV